MYLNFTNSFRKILLLIVLTLTWCVNGSSQTFTIGTGTATNGNTGYPAPYGNWYNGAKHQFLILASELSAAGVTTQRMIQNVAFNVATVQGTPLTDFTIKMANTSATSLNTTYLTGLTSVYSASTYTEVSGWNTHTFGTPFVWDGTSNVVIEVCFDNYPNGYTYNAITYYSSTSFTSANIYYSDNGGVCATASSYTANTSRCNMKFLITTPVAYDVTLAQIVSPTSWAVGNNTITVKATNYGTTAMTAADFGYQLDANTPVTQTGISMSPARTTGQSYNHTFSTALNIATPGTYTLKVWARNPNNTGADGNTSNDTVTTTICTGIGGTYTINPSGSGASNFTSFTAAVDKMISCGVSGPVTFNVAAGTYTEKILIPTINGASVTNTISFIGTDTSTCKLTFASTGASDNYTLQLMGAKYISFKNITFENTGTLTSYTYYFAAYLNSDASYNKFSACKFSVPVLGANYYYYPVAFGICAGNYYSGTVATYDTVMNCRMVGGYYSTVYAGSASNSKNAILGNLIEKYYYMGVTMYPGVGITVADNKIINPIAGATYGIYIYSQSDYAVSRNTIASPAYGIYMGYSGTLGSRFLVDNNIIYNTSTGTFYGIYGYAYGDIIHNSIFSNAGSGYCAYFYSGSNCQFINNILENRGSTGYAFYGATGYFATGMVDYNNYYTTGSNFVYFSAAYLNLAALKLGVPSQNMKSVSAITPFVNTTFGSYDLHLSSSAPALTGSSAFYNATKLDVDGELHCAFAPSIGADESKYNTGVPVAGFTQPDTIFVNSPITLLNNNSSTAPLGHLWYIDGVYMGNGLNLPYTFTATGTYDIKVITFGCFGTDSLTKSVVVFTPTQAPIADFIADLNTVETYQTVKFTDLSVKGPIYWYWTFIPSAGVNFNNGTSNLSQNPIVSFSNPGLYQVCLWDSNAVGRSVQVCKTAYILVKATNQMCIFPFDTKIASGTLYDDGGPNSNYSTGGTCNFLIDPCASSVNLKFASFNLSTNSYFRVYNGTSNLAPALHTGLGFTGTVIPGGAAGLTASSGKMFIEFVKGTSAPGFACSWSSVASSTPAPTGTLAGPTLIYDCGAYSTYTYMPSSLAFDRDAAYYKWWFDYSNSSSFPDVEGKGIYTQDWSYSSTGTYIIRCDIEGCGGIETIYDTITVDHPTTGPVVNFKADLLTATPTDVVNFSDLSTLDPVWWKWTFTGPGSVNAVSGNSNSKNYGVRFGAPGVYSVTLKDSNCVASSTLTKTNYITIIDYCMPAVGTINPDFSIERVTFGRVDTFVNGTVLGFDYTNTSPAVGTVAYRDNTNKLRNYTVNNVTIVNKAVEAVVDLGGSFPFSVKRQSNFNKANFKIWIDFNADGTFQTSELAASSGSTSGVTYSGTISIPSSAQTGYTRMRIGTNFDIQANSPCGPNSFGDFNDFRIKITPDITAPVITFLPNNSQDTVFVEVGRIYTNPGDTVTDNVTNPTPYTRSGITSGSLITTYPSLDFYKIIATDASGNSAVRSRFVKATPDITIPLISLVGSATVYVEVGATYSDSGATATDFYFGSLTSSIASVSNVNTTKVGSYTVTYNVMDAAGNLASTVVRTVIVRDTQKPVITIVGGNTVYVNVFSTFNAPLATVADNYNMGLTYTISGGPVDVNKIGTYSLFYNAADSSGNAATSVTLTVIVRDVTAPTIALIPQDTMIIDCISLTTVPEPGYIVSDNYYPSNQITVSKIGTVNLNVLGTYVVRYYVSDPSGNMDSSKVRVYKIIDRVAPTITLKGLSIMNWPRWKAFVDPGTNIYDKCDPTAAVIADYSKMDINLDGLYEINYTSTDASGNKAAEIKRFVNVYTAVSGLNNLSASDVFNVYPNPTKGAIIIDLNLENTVSAAISIYDATGRIVYSNLDVNALNTKLNIDLSKEVSGIYFIKMVSPNATASKSFTIQK